MQIGPRTKRALLVAILVATAGSPANAVQVFFDRGAFLAAAGGASLQVEDFNGVVTDTALGVPTSRVDFGALSVTGAVSPFSPPPSPSPISGYVDAQPLEISGVNVDGTSQLTTFLSTGPSSGLPYIGLGIDFAELHTAVGMDLVINGTDVAFRALGPLMEPFGDREQVHNEYLTDVTTFFGIIGTSEDEIRTIVLDFFPAEGPLQGTAGVDNIVFGAATIAPEPATGSMLLLGLAFLARARRR